MGVFDEFSAGLKGFEWDEGNADKNWRRHAVRPGEAEQALLNRPLLAALDSKHSQQESRFMALGQTDVGRQLAVVFTIRGAKVRVISARPMSRRERKSYAEAQANPDAHS